jgi:hypothetical protein
MCVCVRVRVCEKAISQSETITRLRKKNWRAGKSECAHFHCAPFTCLINVLWSPRWLFAMTLKPDIYCLPTVRCVRSPARLSFRLSLEAFLQMDSLWTPMDPLCIIYLVWLMIGEILFSSVVINLIIGNCR